MKYVRRNYKERNEKVNNQNQSEKSHQYREAERLQ